MGELEEGEGWVGGGFSLKSSVFAKAIFVQYLHLPESGNWIGIKWGFEVFVWDSNCSFASTPPPFFALVFPPQSSEIGKKENFP
jgi:hypothetical protein